MMERKQAYTVGAVVVLILVVLGVAYWSSAPAAPASTPATSQTQQPPPVDATFAPPATVVVHHTVQGNVHTFTGEVTIPSGCDTLASGIASGGTDPISVTLNLEVLTTGGAGCATAGSGMQTFTASFMPGQAGATVALKALTINGASVPFTESSR